MRAQYSSKRPTILKIQPSNRQNHNFAAPFQAIDPSFLSNKDRLDLIFKNQPPQIQKKLVQLLIRYNAVLQYNRQSQMFQVDLLIPFVSLQQKEMFIRQFYQIRNHNKNNMVHTFAPQNNINDNGSWNSEYRQIRKFSFNPTAPHIGDQSLSRKQTNQNIQKELWINQINNQFDKSQEEVKPEIGHQIKSIAEIVHHIGQFRNMAKQIIKEKPLDFKSIDEILGRKINNAVYLISHKMSNVEQNWPQAQSILSSEQRLSDPKQQGSIGRLHSQQSNFGYNNYQEESKIILHNVQFVKTEKQERLGQNHYNNQREDNYGQIQYTSYHSPFIKINEEPQEDDQYEPVFSMHSQEVFQPSKGVKEGKVISFEDFAVKYQEKKHNNKKNRLEKTFGTTYNSLQQAKGQLKDLAKGNKNMKDLQGKFSRIK